MGVVHCPTRTPMPCSKRSDKPTRATNCRNCGAPLPSRMEQVVLYAADKIYSEHGTKCEYCGTRIA